MAGAPTHWATLSGDADSNPGFRDVWMYDFDAISPWTIGRYGSEDAADRYAVERIRTDMELLKTGEARGGRKVDYVPVVFPGGSVSFLNISLLESVLTLRRAIIYRKEIGDSMISRVRADGFIGDRFTMPVRREHA